MNRLNKQKGVVLIACLVFLILILGLLKISIGSSQITEKKSGIDMDILDAKESAETVIRTAIDTFLPAPDPSVFPACRNAASRACKSAVMLAAKKSWRDPSKLSSTGNLAASNGLYDGTLAYGACGGSGSVPLWQCVNWGGEFHKNYSVTQNLNPVSVGRGAYIVESFPADKMGITSGTGKNSVMLRVTALGIGKETPGGRPTNVMLQANYLIQ